MPNEIEKNEKGKSSFSQNANRELDAIYEKSVRLGQNEIAIDYTIRFIALFENEPFKMWER